MFGMFRNPPRAGGTDEAARRILELLEREEREKQALRRLKAEGWRAPEDSAPPAPERRFGDGRDDLMQMVQADLDQRQAMQDEARRRVQLAQAGAGLPIPPRKPTPPTPSWLPTWRAPAPPGNQFASPFRSSVAVDDSRHYADRNWQQKSSDRSRLIDSTIDSIEKGFSNHPADRRGKTKFGITTDAIADYFRLYRIAPDLYPKLRQGLKPETITRDEAEAIYDTQVRGYKLNFIEDPDIRAQVIDIMVNSGPDTAGKLFLDTLVEHGYDVKTGPDDNVIGSRARAVIRDLRRHGEWEKLARINNTIARRRHQHYEDIIREDPSQEVFREGWHKRARRFSYPSTGPQQ